MVRPPRAVVAAKSCGMRRWYVGCTGLLSPKKSVSGPRFTGRQGLFLPEEITDEAR
jgi:hypothetical protein